MHPASSLDVPERATASPGVIDASRVTTSPGRRPSWSLAQRVGFRFFFVYAVLYSAPTPLDSLPGSSALADRYTAIVSALAARFGARVLGMAEPIALRFNGSGDRRVDYAQCALFVLVAAVATLVWSLVDRRRRAHPVLLEGLRVYTRYALAVTMLSYGVSKLAVSQFPHPRPSRMFEPFGVASPMGVLWAFMGYATGYAVFCGAAEYVAGVLLFWRRTTTLGATLMAIVMTNVFVLNLVCDVPVKLLSGHLLAFAIFLAAPDARALFDFFVHRRPAVPAPVATVCVMPRARPALRVVKALLVVTCVATNAWDAHRRWEKYGPGAQHAATYGAYDVEVLTRDGSVIPPLTTEANRWRRVAVEGDRFVVEHMDDSQRRYGLVEDAASRTLTIEDYDTDAALTKLAYVLEGDALRLDGTWEGALIHAEMRRCRAWPVTTRGFHWVNEAPFNR